MDVMPIDLTAIVAIIMGISIVLVPVIGLTARFALKPFVESLGHFFQARNVEESVRILERRMALLEQQLESMETTVMRVSDAADFHRELRSGPADTAGIPAAHLTGTVGRPTPTGPGAPPGDSRP